MLVLGIETSCDETAVGIVADGRRMLANVIASQAEIHARYGGIVPEVASRHHIEAMLPVVKAALIEAKCKPSDLDAVAVTAGPGLAGSLLVGLNTAKALAYAWSKPLIAVNHLEGHIYANWLSDAGETPTLPAVILIVSGGHSELVWAESHGNYRLLGRTRDDAAGEAFDKVARILGLGFPGGPAIEKAAREAGPKPSRLPRAWMGDSADFSFSGLKTAVGTMARELGVNAEDSSIPERSDRLQRGLGGVPQVKAVNAADSSVPERSDRLQRRLGGVPQVPSQSVPQVKADIAAGFQNAVVDVLTKKTVAVAKAMGASCILLSGGVAANGPLRASLREAAPMPVYMPPPVLCTDNGAMIAAAGHFRAEAGLAGLDLDVRANWPIAG